MSPNPTEFAEDTCDHELEDGTVCGRHVGYGIRLLHLRRCDEHAYPDFPLCDKCGDAHDPSKQCLGAQ
jgi:hypothetical protein